jgi:gas vesicle protein
MKDWPVIETAPVPCFLCGSVTGPFLLTDKRVPRLGFTNDLGDGPALVAVTVCRDCGKTAAHQFGFAKGDKLDELETAAKMHDEWEKEKRQLLENNDMLIEQYDIERRSSSLLSEQNSQLKGRVAQLEARIKERAEADLALAQ